MNQRTNCPCGKQLLYHKLETCAPTHKERLRKLIHLVRTNKNIKLVRNNLSIIPQYGSILSYCIYVELLSKKRDYVDTSKSSCIACGKEITYRGQLREYTMTLGEFECYGCPSCYQTSGICLHTLEPVYKCKKNCPHTLEALDECKERQRQMLVTAVLVFKHYRLPKDIRLLLIPLLREACMCLKIKQKKT
jgi:hypothetical protein